MAIKTTVYLPEDLKALIEQEAVFRACSEAEVIRGAIAASYNCPHTSSQALQPPTEPMEQAFYGFGNP